VNIKLLWPAAVLLLAFTLLWLLPSDTGFTVYLSQHTRYISLRIVAFWTTLAIALVVGAFVLLGQYRRA
jgi:hypothetical protein